MLPNAMISYLTSIEIHVAERNDKVSYINSNRCCHTQWLAIKHKYIEFAKDKRKYALSE